MSKDWFIVEIDGNKVLTKDQLFNSLIELLYLPDYFSRNLDSLEELLNDLSWIDAENYKLIIRNSQAFLSEELEIEKEKVLKLLENVKQEWENVPNFEGEESFRKKSNFILEFV